MRYRSKALLLVLALFIPACSGRALLQEDDGRQDPPMRIELPVEELVLDNGMRVLIVPKKGAPRVFCSLWWRVGSVNEHPGLTGISHFFEHMMFKGTRTLGTRDPEKDAELGRKIEAVMDRVREIKLRNLDRRRRGRSINGEDEQRMKELLQKYQELVEARKAITISEHLSKLYKAHGGTGLNASTSYDRTNYYVELPSNKVELFFWLESDRFIRPVFREFYPEREVVKEERRMRTDSTPTGLINEAYRAGFWQAHPYSWPVIGWMSDIDNYTLEDARAYFEKHYSPQNCTAVFVGDVEVGRIKSLAKRYFGRLERFGEDPEPIVTQEPSQKAEKRMEAEADADDHWTCRWHGPSQVHEDAAVLDVLTSALSGRTGRLYRRLVLEKKIALNVSAWFWGLRYGGVLNIDASPRIPPKPEEMDAEFYRAGRTARIQEVERAALEVIEEIKRDGLTDRELEKVKNRIIAGEVRDMREIGGIGNTLGYWETIGTWKDMNRWLAGVQKVTNEDIKRAANEYFPANGRNILIIRRKLKEDSQ